VNNGMKTVIYPVGDIAKAKALFGKLLGAEPYVDQAYYVGFRVGDQEVGLDPNGHKQGMTGYWHVDDIRGSLQALLEAGAQLQEDGWEPDRPASALMRGRAGRGLADERSLALLAPHVDPAPFGSG